MNGKLLLYALSAVVAVAFIVFKVYGIESSALTDSLYWRAMYIFFHGGVLHAAANAMCLVAIARSDFRVPSHFVVMAIVVAMCAPMGDGSATVGCSGVYYAVLGAISWQSIDVKRYHALIALFIALGCLPWMHVNYMLHTFCYAEGVMFGWICKD